MKRPLAEIVADYESRIAEWNTDSPNANTCVTVNLHALERLCQAFRAAEKMRANEFADNSGDEYTPICPHCGIKETAVNYTYANGRVTSRERIKNKHKDDCPIAEWDRVTGGSDE